MLARTDLERGRFARLVGAGNDEIGVLFATSEGENIVAYALDLGPKDNVLLDELRYETEFVLYRQLAKTRGVELRVAKAVDGAVPPRAFEALVDIAHAHGALLYADAIQAVGMFPIDRRWQGVDVLCCGTYTWLLGGFGVAPFYVRRDLPEQIRLDRFGALPVERDLA